MGAASPEQPVRGTGRFAETLLIDRNAEDREFKETALGRLRAPTRIPDSLPRVVQCNDGT